MAKMLRSRKHFSRCHIHGNNPCEVTVEIQSREITRAQDKREWQAHVEFEIEEMKECA